LPVTDEDGYIIQFWANSSYGDSSEMFDALVRVAVAETGDPDRSFWYADVLSDQSVGVPIASCVQAWGTLPPVGGPPKWLTTPPQSESLGTNIPYTYLASQLIRAGIVDGAACRWRHHLMEQFGLWMRLHEEVTPGRIVRWHHLNVERDRCSCPFAEKPVRDRKPVLPGATSHGYWAAPTERCRQPCCGILRFPAFCSQVRIQQNAAKYLHLDDEQQKYVRPHDRFCKCDLRLPVEN
jgi:hypothetical protein